MNWKLVLQLSLFGLAMAIGSVFVIPDRVETPLWPVVFLVVAFLVARHAPRLHFLHGFFVGLVNWFWVSTAHLLLFHPWAARHAGDLAALAAMPMPSLPPWAADVVRAFRARSIPIPGASGVIIGLLSWVASKIPASKGRLASR